MLIVGLGNPGSTYKNTRHNIGFMVIDKLIQQISVKKINKSSFNGELFKYNNNFLLKPMTYMNLSGDSVRAVKNFYKIDCIVVVHDDLDLPFGAVRFKKGGGSGGHNGLKSIDETISNDYIRIRMGITRPQNTKEIVSYVLSSFTQTEVKLLNAWIQHAVDAILKLQDTSLQNIASLYTIK